MNPIPGSRTEHLTEHGRRVQEALWRVGSHERLYTFLVYEDSLSPGDSDQVHAQGVH